MAETFYLLACRECATKQQQSIMPFGSAAERGKWAAAHTHLTGHDHWWVKDEVRDDSPDAPGLPAVGTAGFD